MTCVGREVEFIDNTFGGVLALGELAGTAGSKGDAADELMAIGEMEGLRDGGCGVPFAPLGNCS